MPTKSHYEQLIDEKFRGVYARIDAQNIIADFKLDKILTQTTKTNGHVAELFDRIQKVEEHKCPAPTPPSLSLLIKEHQRVLIILGLIIAALLGLNVLDWSIRDLIRLL